MTYGTLDHLAFFGHTDRSGGVDIVPSSDSLGVLIISHCEACTPDHKPGKQVGTAPKFRGGWNVGRGGRTMGRGAGASLVKMCSTAIVLGWSWV
jgi:hypothetical protein